MRFYTNIGEKLNNLAKGDIMDREIINYNLPELLFNMKTIVSGASGKYRGIHSHSAVELVHVNAGTLYCTVNDETHTLTSGMTILINSYVVHKLSSKRDFDITYIQIDLSNLTDAIGCTEKGYINEYINTKNMLPYIISNDGELTRLFLNMKTEAEKESRGFQLYLKGYFYHLAAFMSRNCFHSPENMLSQSSMEKILPVIRHIEINYMSPLTLDSLCGLIPCDRFALCKYFKNATGGTVVDYINFVRLRKACELLHATEKSILDISFECGFASVQYFNRIFKQNAGCTPRSYRNTKLYHI